MRAASSHEGLVQTPTLNEPAPLQLFKVASDELRSQHNRAHANVLERLVEAGEVRHGDDVDEEARADDNAHPKGEAQLKRGCGAGMFRSFDPCGFVQMARRSGKRHWSIARTATAG